MSPCLVILLALLGAVASAVVLTGLVRRLLIAARSGYFEGKVALITGASRGIGRELALQLASRGAHLVLAARSEDQLREVAAACKARNPRVGTLIVPTDVTNEIQLAHLAEQAEAQFGRIDILINNAGILQVGDFVTVGRDSVRQTIEVNLMSAMYLTQLVLPLMRRQGSGHVVMMASLMGRHAMPFYSAYSTSKYALIGFAESLRRELQGTGIRVLTVKPGFTATDMVAVAQKAYRKMGFFKMIPTERVARRTLEGIVLGLAEVSIGWLDRVAAWLNKLSPPLMDFYWRHLVPRDFEEIVSGQRTE